MTNETEETRWDARGGSVAFRDKAIIPIYQDRSTSRERPRSGNRQLLSFGLGYLSDNEQGQGETSCVGWYCIRMNQPVEREQGPGIGNCHEGHPRPAKPNDSHNEEDDRER